MSGRNILFWSVASLVILIAGAAMAESNQIVTLDIGASAPDFNLPGVDGRNYRLADFAEANILVIVFTANHCPTAQAYEGRIMQLVTDYKDKGVAVIAISPNNPLAVRLDELGYSDLGDSFEEMKIRADERKFNFPYLYDGQTQSVSVAYSPVSTPHVFIFDKQRQLQYAGAIDNAEDPSKIKKNCVRDALDALLEGREVAVKKVKPFGCSIKWADKRKLVEKGFQEWAREPVDVNLIDANGVRDLMKNNSGKLRLVNIWATWCGPCIIEIPELVNINRMYRGRAFEMVTISGDVPGKKDNVLAFLKNKQVSCTNYLFSSDDRPELVEAIDKNWEGGIPYTVIVKPGGEIIYRHSGFIDPLEVKKVIIGCLGRYYF
ncbi:MAG: redoxin domain-containing protein [Sedimentisphaerales bacterium]|nr:redoxin domain-containing protein [Sedimentisphaerales bacterium]